MAGNVWEWTSSHYCRYDSPECGDSRRVIRGGGWDTVESQDVRAARRLDGHLDQHAGFRGVVGHRKGRQGPRHQVQRLGGMPGKTGREAGQSAQRDLHPATASGAHARQHKRTGRRPLAAPQRQRTPISVSSRWALSTSPICHCM